MGDDYAVAAIVTFWALTGVMLLAMFTRTEPYPPLEVEQYALRPFLVAPWALGVASYGLVVRGRRFAMVIAPLFALTLHVSHGPQQYVDSAFARLWPALIVAQVAIAVIL